MALFACLVLNPLIFYVKQAEPLSMKSIGSLCRLPPLIDWVQICEPFYPADKHKCVYHGFLSGFT